MNQNLQEAARNAARVHRESLRKNLQRRLEVARSQGNDRLVRQLEDEAKYLQLQ